MSPIQQSIPSKGQNVEPQPLEQKISSVVKQVKCELIKEDLGLKVVRLFASYDKYFEAIKGDDGKGLVVDGYIDDDFEDFGIGLGWKLSKLGKRNVVKTSFIMLRNQLMAQASTAKKFGYELTFIDDTIKQNSSSSPNSPNIKYSEKTNIPQTAPLGPVTAPNMNKDTKNKDTKNENMSNKEAVNEAPQIQQAQDPFNVMP